MEDARTSTARTELQSWYQRGLLPKLERAAAAGAVDARALAALDADVRALLDLSREREEAA
jgi:hypothetical protein